MLLGKKKDLKDHIVEALIQKNETALSIESYLKDKKVVVTIQGIYKAIRELIADDVVVKEKKTYSISSVWKNKLSEKIAQTYTFKLQPKEKIIYQFTNIEHTDAFWKHIFQDIQSEVRDFPIFHYMPHQYWVLIESRKESEYEYYKRYDREKIYDFNIIGGNTIFDNMFRKEISTDYNQIDLNPRADFNRRDHISIIGPYIIVTKVSLKFAREVDALYTNCVDIKELKGKIESYFKKSGALTIQVEHNKERADTLRRKMSKNFYIPKELQKKVFEK